MRFMLILALIILLVTGSISCGGIPEDKVRAHIEKHGRGIDMTGLWSKGKINYQIKRMNFKQKGR